MDLEELLRIIRERRSPVPAPEVLAQTPPFVPPQAPPSSSQQGWWEKSPLQRIQSALGYNPERIAQARSQRMAEAGQVEATVLNPAPHAPTDDARPNAPQSGRVLGVPPSEGGNAATGGIRGTGFDLSEPTRIAAAMAKTGIKPPAAPGRKGTAVKPKPRGKPDTSPSLNVSIVAPKITDEHPESGVGPGLESNKLERILLEEYGIGGGAPSGATAPPTGRSVLIPDPRNPGGPFIPVPVAGEGTGATPEGLPSSTGAPTRPRRTKPEVDQAAEMLRLMTPQLSVEQGADRNRYYNAEKQYMHKEGMYHPEEKHKGWKGRLLHGLMGAGLGIVGQAQPNARGEFDLGRMLGGGALSGIWGGARPQAADQLYNKIMVQPEAERERAKQIAAENVEFEKVRRGTALTGEQQRQVFAERDQAMQEEKQGWEREQLPLMTEQIKVSIAAAKANATRDLAAAAKAANMPDINWQAGIISWPDGTVQTFNPGRTQDIQQVWEIVRNINAGLGTPEQQANREGVDEGEINDAMKKRYGAGTVDDLLSLEEAGRTAQRDPKTGMFTYGPNQKSADENMYQEALKRLEKMREEARKIAMQSKEGRIAGSRGSMAGGVAAPQQAAPGQNMSQPMQRRDRLLGINPYTP